MALAMQRVTLHLGRRRAWPGTAVKPTAKKCLRGRGRLTGGVSKVGTAETLQKLGWGLPGVKIASQKSVGIPSWVLLWRA